MNREVIRLTRRGAVLLPLAAAGCKTLTRWFGDTKKPLPGTRVSIGGTQRGLKVDNPTGRAVVLPAETVETAWPQSGSGPTHAPGNPAFAGTMQVVWKAKIGAPSGYRRRITATPVVGGGRVFAMDSAAMVSAYDQRTGAQLWHTVTREKDDRSTNVGGGISLDGNTLYAATGLADVIAFDVATGKIRWRRRLDSPARAAPTIVGDRLFVPTLAQQVLSFATSDGSSQWTYQSTGTPDLVLGLPSPAYADGLLVAGFGTGDLACLRATSGVVSWTDQLASAGSGAMLDFPAISALPVITEGSVYAIGLGGLLVAIDLRTGRRVWEREVASVQSPWLAGDWLFVLTPDQILGAVNRNDGTIPWVTQLPLYKNEKEKKVPIEWVGPLVAGGRLFVFGTSREAVSINPATGAIIAHHSLPGEAIVLPVVAERAMFLVTKDAMLIALR